MNRRIALIPSLFAVCLAAGCGSFSNDASVSGDVTSVHPITQQKLPVVYGTITFVHLDSDKVAEGEIVNGKYSVEGVYVGKNRVEITPLEPTGLASSDEDEGGDKAAKLDLKRWFPIADTYGDKDSPLAYDVKEGAQTKAFHLEEAAELEEREDEQ